MLKLLAVSSNAKTGPIATTYRSGAADTYGTCPRTCALHPAPERGTDAIDLDYLAALRDAVPRRGHAWTYTHFAPELIPLPAPGKTIINISADTPEAAILAHRMGHATVYAAAAGTPDLWRMDGVRFVRCPAETQAVTCHTCGGGRPLCARERDYIIQFTAHGSQAARVGTGTGGCYAAAGRTVIHWHKTRTHGVGDDATAIKKFARALPVGSFLRHHVAGDIGHETAA